MIKFEFFEGESLMKLSNQLEEFARQKNIARKDIVKIYYHSITFRGHLLNKVMFVFEVSDVYDAIENGKPERTSQRPFNILVDPIVSPEQKKPSKEDWAKLEENCRQVLDEEITKQYGEPELTVSEPKSMAQAVDAMIPKTYEKKFRGRRGKYGPYKKTRERLERERLAREFPSLDEEHQQISVTNELKKILDKDPGGLLKPLHEHKIMDEPEKKKKEKEFYDSLDMVVVPPDPNSNL